MAEIHDDELLGLDEFALLPENAEQIGAPGPLPSVRRIGKTKAGQVRSNHTIFIGQRWNKIAKHVRRGGKAMKQQNCRSISPAGRDVLACSAG